MLTLHFLDFKNITPLKTCNSGLMIYVILLFSIMVTSQFSFFQNESFGQAVQPQLIPPSPTTTNGQSQPPIQITAGKIQNLSFKIDLSNRNPSIINYPQSITDIAVFVASQSSSVKIIGPTTWSLPRLDSNSSQLMSTKVYASPSTIGNPVFFTVTIQYIKNGQELKTNSFDIGAIVIGDIKIEANNLAIRYLGDTPNLVGNLLNKGNSGALFTNLQVLSVSLQSETRDEGEEINLLPGTSQFLGTLPPNTPTPFSIPISIDLAVLQSGGNKINQSSNTGETNSSDNFNPSLVTNSTSYFDNTTTINPIGLSNTVYLVSLKITYSDELINNHEIIVNNSIPYGLVDNISETSSSSNINGSFSTNHSAPTQLEQLQQVQTGIESVLNNGFVDAYWAENIPSSSSNSSSSGTSAASTGEVQFQREVGPGEGPAILAVVLTNTAFSDITGITGYLTLPDGFSTLVPLSSAGVSYNENVKQNYPAIASISNVVKAGETYTLFFKVDILKTASVGLHTATLRTYYFKTPDPETGAYRVQTTSVPFVLAGKVVLDTSSSSTDLTPGEVNHVKIQIRNKGTADANNVVVTLNSAGGSIITSTGDLKTNLNISSDVAGKILEDNLTAPSSDQRLMSNHNMEQEASSLGSRIFNLGTIAARSAGEIDAAILPSYSAGESLQNLNLQVSYTDATGKTKSSDEIVGFRVLPNLPEAGLAVNPNAIPQGTSNPNTSTESNGANESSSNNNDGTTSESGLSVTPSSLASSIVTSNDYYQGVSLAHIVNRSSPINNRALIENHSYYTGNNLTSTQSGESLIKKVSLSDTSNGIDNDKSTINQDNNNRSDNKNSDDSITITAGKESNLNFTITNNNRYPILDAVVSLDSQSTSIAISGPSKWNLQRLDPGSHQFYSTTVFASTAIIGSPVSFEVGVQYIMNGRARNDTFNIGAKVIGEINVDVSNIAINNIAGTPNLIGNLLNKGNTVALFTTIQLLPQGNSTDQNQRLQDRHPSSTTSQSSQDVNSQKSSGNGSSSRPSSDLSVGGLVPVSNFPSYLGDLDANSPLPFSIPLALKNNSSPGSYPISLRITYSDDLRVDHALIINSSVDLTRPRQRSGDDSNQNQGFLGILIGKQYSLQIGGISLPIPLILIIVALSLVLLILRRRRRSATRRIYAASKSSKEDKFFLDGKGNKDQGTISTNTNLENERSKGSGAEGTGGLNDMNKEVDDSGEKK